MSDIAKLFAELLETAIILDPAALRAEIDAGRDTGLKAQTFDGPSARSADTSLRMFGNSVDSRAETVFTKDMTTQRPYRITSTATGRTVTAKSFHAAQVCVARQIASDVEGQVVTITGPEGVTICRNNGLTIRYEAA